MPEIKLRYNKETEEAEAVIDGEVFIASGPEVFASWVESYNNAHPAPPASDAPVDTEVKVEPALPETPVEETKTEVSEEVVAEVDKPTEPVVD